MAGSWGKFLLLWGGAKALKGAASRTFGGGGVAERAKKAAGIPAGLWGHMGLFVVFASCGDAEGAVEGFEEKHAHQLVGEGQFGEGEPPVASRLDLGC